MDPWSEAIMAAMDSVRPAVVNVQAVTPSDNSVALGSGVVVDYYHVVTTAQIAAKDDEVTVTTADGKRYGATVLGLDPLYFLAVLKTDRRLQVELPTFCKPDQIRPGQVVVAVGNAFGDYNVTTGVVSAADRTIYRPERFPVDGLVITDAAVHPGNVGGALARLDGQIVGLAGIPWSQGLGLAVEGEVVARVANQIIDYGEATHPWLGFSGQQQVVEKVMADLFSLPSDRGLLVSHVADSGPGNKAGVEEGDLILSCQGRPVSTVGHIRRVMSLRQPGETVTLTVFRGSEMVELQIPVEQMPRLTARE